jgi:hypothetical protein
MSRDTVPLILLCLDFKKLLFNLENRVFFKQTLYHASWFGPILRLIKIYIGKHKPQLGSLIRGLDS